MIQKFHATRCECGADLVGFDTVYVHFSVGGGSHEFDLGSEIGVSGRLTDRTRLVANGYHAGTYCIQCKELLDELEPAVKRFSWMQLHALLIEKPKGEELQQDE